MNFYENLKAICESKGMKLTPTVLQCGGTKGVISGWKRGTYPNSEIVMQLSVLLNVPSDVLLFGTQKILSNELSADEQELLNNFKRLSKREQTKLIGRAELLAEQAEQEQSVNNKSIQLKHDITVSHTAETTVKCKHGFYKVSAGTGFDLDDNNFWEEIDIPATPEAKKADFCLTITGDSMEPVYYDGDIVLVKSQPSVNLGQIGIFVIEGSGYIKKFGGDRLISLNEEYDDIVFADYNSEDIRCSGLVIGRV